MKIDELPSKLSDAIRKMISCHKCGDATREEIEYAERIVADSIADQIGDTGEAYYHRGYSVGHVVGCFEKNPLTAQTLADMLHIYPQEDWHIIISNLRSSRSGREDAADVDTIAAEAIKLASSEPA